jgi:hypothetical protein
MVAGTARSHGIIQLKATDRNTILEKNAEDEMIRGELADEKRKRFPLQSS